jgi:hypothetical protein
VKIEHTILKERHENYTSTIRMETVVTFEPLELHRYHVDPASALKMMVKDSVTQRAMSELRRQGRKLKGKYRQTRRAPL